VAGAAAAAIALTRGETAALTSLPAGVALISAKDGSLIAELPTSAIAQPVEVFTGNGRFWIVNLDPPSTVEVDPSTGAVVRRLGSVFPGEPGFPLPHGRVVWSTQGAELVRVNWPRAATSSGTADPAPRASPAETRSARPPLGRGQRGVGQLRVEPGDRRSAARIPAQNPWAVGCGDGEVWITS
jgi:hypothetical protein